MITRVKRLSRGPAESVKAVGLTYGRFWKLFHKETRDGGDWEFEGNVTILEYCAERKVFRVHDLFCHFETEEISFADFEAQTRELLRGAP